MLECPRCHQPIEARSITCPHCGCILKAHGHPGIPLHRATGEDYLCRDCVYDADDSCTFPQRPFARECTLYRRQGQVVSNFANPEVNPSIRHWLQRHQVWLALLGLIAMSFLLVL